jgi:predicted 2-oxoglutarate/Fe(II)-dependent dioxygenase YbiX
LSAWPPLPPLSVGDFAPRFTAATRVNAKFHFSTLPGRYVLLGFLPNEAAARAAMMAAIEPVAGLFAENTVLLFWVVRDAETIATAQDAPGRRWFFDPDGEVSRLYGALEADGTERPFWLLTDPMLRILDKAAPQEGPALLQRLPQLPRADLHAGVPLSAPVAVVPRVLEPEVCRRLIDIYEAQGGQLSGVMRDIGGKTVGVLDRMKSRRDVSLTDPDLQKLILNRIARRLAPEIRRVFNFDPTRLERYLIACYDAGEGGYFRPHRDNETLATAHRRFAVSINLNAEDFEGGDLRFPEFGPRTYRPPTGGAVVFCCSLQHEATPVTKGRRFAFLPFLYDEEGQRIREQNLAFLDLSAKPGQGELA